MKKRLQFLLSLLATQKFQEDRDVYLKTSPIKSKTNLQIDKRKKQEKDPLGQTIKG